MLDLTGTNGTSLGVDDQGDHLVVAARGTLGIIVDLDAVASLTIALLNWLNRQPSYSGLALDISTKHLEAKVRQNRPA